MNDFIRKHAPLWLFRMIINRAWEKILGWDTGKPYLTCKILDDFDPRYITPREGKK